MTRWLVALLLCAAPATALAYHPGATFGEAASLGGGGGIYFTGAPRWRGWNCSICHVEAPRQVGIELASEPPGLFADGVYQPGATYAVTVRMTGEHRGARSDLNTFLLELDDAAGEPIAGFADYDPDVVRPVDSGRVLFAVAAEERVEWTFGFVMPAAGAGPLGLYLAAVDGDGAGDATRARTDPLGDDVAAVAVALCEGAPGCDTAFLAVPRFEDGDRAPDARFGPAACAAAPPGRRAPSPAWPVCALVAAACFLRRARATALVALLAAAPSCHDPVLPVECSDRICGDAAVGPPPADAPPPCSEDWRCSSWEAPLGSDQATRSCVDANDRGTTVCKPTEGPVTLPALDRNYFMCNVEPILDRGCAFFGCHGTDEGRPFRVYARGRLRNSELVDRVSSCLGTGTVNLQEAGSGTAMCEGWLPHTEAEWKKNFDSARSFMLGVAEPAQSELLAQPVVGGKPHVGVHLFREADADYQTLRAWLDGATLPSCDPRPN